MSRDIWWHQGSSRDIWGHPGTSFLTCYSCQWQIWRRARGKEFQWLHSQTPAPLKCRYVDMSRRCPTSFPSSPCPRIERRRRRRTRIRQSSCIILLKSKEIKLYLSDDVKSGFLDGQSSFDSFDDRDSRIDMSAADFAANVDGESDCDSITQIDAQPRTAFQCFQNHFQKYTEVDFFLLNSSFQRRLIRRQIRFRLCIKWKLRSLLLKRGAANSLPFCKKVMLME